MFLRRAAAVLVSSAALVAGCSTPGSPPAGPGPAQPRPGSPSPSRTRPPIDELLRSPLAAKYGDFPAYAVTATVATVAVHEQPGGVVRHRLAHPQPSGAPLTFLLRAERDGWLHVYLPVRPNGSSGWIRAGEATVQGVAFRVDVHLAAHELVLFEWERERARYPIAVGTRDTPTPGGTFYLKELLQPPDPGGPYGPYAYGLSGFSTVLSSFAGGEGVIGLHGTNDESLIGRDVSHGCIRMRNRDITALAALLPLGTPVRILA